MMAYLRSQQNREATFGPAYQKYFRLHYDKDNKMFLLPEENIQITEKKLNLCGYFVIVTSDKMTAKEALHIYKSRDMSEKVFRGDKTYLDDKSLRVHSTESTFAKIFIEFVAMIIRNKMYTCLIDEMNSINKITNYMTVPVAIRDWKR